MKFHRIFYYCYNIKFLSSKTDTKHRNETNETKRKIRIVSTIIKSTKLKGGLVERRTINKNKLEAANAK